MPLFVRAASACRWNTRLSEPRTTTDVVRVLEQDGIHLVALANGFDCGFSTCWPPGSRRMLDLFFEAWGASTGSVRERLFEAFEGARRRFEEEAPRLAPKDTDLPEDVPGAVLLVVVTEGTSAHAAWIGGEVALLARGMRVETQTTQHTLRERFARDNPGLRLDLEQLPNALSRTIGLKAVEPEPAEHHSFELQPGDTLVCLSKTALDGDGELVAEAAFAAGAHASPTLLAERLADHAFDHGAPYAAAAVVRFDDFDVASVIDELIDDYVPEWPRTEWLHAWSRKQRALPVVIDPHGVWAMRPDGSVVSVAWDDKTRAIEPLTSVLAQIEAVVGAARRYPRLASLAPRRPPDARDCPHCEHLNPKRADGGGCPMCMLLGWELPMAPAWFHAQLGEERPEIEEEPPPRRPWWKRLAGRSN